MGVCSHAGKERTPVRALAHDRINRSSGGERLPPHGRVGTRPQPSASRDRTDTSVHYPRLEPHLTRSHRAAAGPSKGYTRLTQVSAVSGKLHSGTSSEAPDLSKSVI